MFTIFNKGELVCTIHGDMRRERVVAIADVFGLNTTVLINEDTVYYNSNDDIMGEGILQDLLKIQKRINKKLKILGVKDD